MTTITAIRKKIPATVGGRIKELREAFLVDGKAMSQGELARRIGISRAAVSQWESGDVKGLKGENLMKLAKALKTSEGYIQDGKEGGRVGVSVSDEATELAHAWDKMPDGELKERIYLFVTTFEMLGKRFVTDQHTNQARHAKRYRNIKGSHN